MAKINSISIKGFKSIKNLKDLKLSPGLNIMIGANGAGKSNFLSFFRLLNKIIKDKLEWGIKESGGVHEILYNGPKVTKNIEARIYFNNHNSGYDFKLKCFNQDSLILDKQKVYSKAPYLDNDLEEKWIPTDIAKTDHPMNQPIISAFQKLKVYHFCDTTPLAEVKKTGYGGDNLALAERGRNLTPMLYKFQQANNPHYKEIVETIQMVAPFFKDFVLKRMSENKDNMNLKWQSKGTDQVFSVNQLSDGTLRFICLTTLLLQPNPPSTIIIDEPELGLHPDALSLLAGMLRSVSANTQIIVSTQSALFLNEFKVDDIIVVDRKDGQSIFSRLKEEDLKNWLEDYTLGELWEKNVIGGKPYSTGPF